MSPLSHPVSRFAPSPNGYLHLGHAYAALAGYAFARAIGAKFLLRIENIDRERCRSVFEEAIYDDLRWLGLAWEEPVLRQSEHLTRYQQAITRLDEKRLLYRCYASRKEIAAAVARLAPEVPRLDPLGAPRHPGRGLVLGRQEERRRQVQARPFTLRLDMKKALAQLAGPLTWTETNATNTQQKTVKTVRAKAQHWGDVAMAGRHMPVMYNLAVVLDDAHQGISHVVRGRDIAPMTAIHRVLQALLQLPEPVYHHHRLILDEDGRKLSKSTQATSLRTLRAQGMTRNDIKAMIGFDGA